MIGLKVPTKSVLNDLVTGLVMAVSNVPQALANGLLAGVTSEEELGDLVIRGPPE